MVNIYRENSNVDHELPYKILIDNIPVFEIYEDEIRNIKLEPGKHKISVKSEKYISNVLEFEETEDSIIEFSVEPDYVNNAISKFFTNTLYGKVGLKVSFKKEFYI